MQVESPVGPCCKAAAGLITSDLEELAPAPHRFIASDLEELASVQPSGNSLLEDWRLFCRKEKATFATLNHFQGEGALLRCDVW